MYIKNNISLIITSLLCILLGASNSLADISSSGDIAVMDPLKIEELDTLNFGTIEKPTERVWVGVKRNGNSEGTANLLDTSEVKNGLVKISGSNTETINMQATDLETYPDLSFRRIRGEYGDSIIKLKQGKSNITPPTTSGTEMLIFARLWVENTITTGDYEPAFSIEVLYD